METLFFIFIVIILIIGLICMQNKKENMGGDPIADLKLENKFRDDQIDYYRKKNQDIHTNCAESKFIELTNNKKRFKKVGVCDFFTGKNVKENFYAGDVVPMEASKYTEEIETCKHLNQSLQKSIDTSTTLPSIIKKIQQIPEFKQIESRDNSEDDKGCGYCYNKDGVAGEILYGDSLGPYKNVRTGNVCETWIKPGDLRRGGGTDIKNNMWRSKDDPEKMEFGGNQGVIDDSIKLHEQQICSKVQNCGDLDGEKKICGWCYMGRKGDGKGEGMVAMVDAEGKKIGETKYMDDYCPWPGEVSRSGKPTKQWTGPTEGSAWLKEQANQDYSAADIQKIDLQLQQDKINQLTAKKNNDALTPKERNMSSKMIKYVENTMRFIMNFGKQSKTKGDGFGETYKQWKEKTKATRGSDENNQFLYKCGQNTPATKDNIFFLHSYNGLSEEQKVILKGLHETHEFFKKCHTNMSILGKKITLNDNEELITKCHQLSNILNKTGNEKLKKLFFTLDLSKDKSGCLENCQLTAGKTIYDSTNKIFKNWWSSDTADPKCKELTLTEILSLTGSSKTVTKLEKEIESAPTVENSSCCQDEWDSVAQKFKKCSESSKPSQEYCKGGCQENVTEDVCKLYAQDLGLDITDENVYNNKAFVNQGYPFGCSTNYEGTHVVYVEKLREDDITNRAEAKTTVKKKTDILNDKKTYQRDIAIPSAEGHIRQADSKNSDIAYTKRAITYYKDKIDRMQSEINRIRHYNKKSYREPYRQYYNARVWKRNKYKKRSFWGRTYWVGGYVNIRRSRLRYRTKWYLPSNEKRKIDSKERTIDHYKRRKDYWKTRRDVYIGVKTGHETASKNIRFNAQQDVTTAETDLANANGPETDFKTPVQQGENRTTRYSVCGLSNNDGIDYPTQTAKMFRHDPDTGLRENINGWAKIVNREKEITSFEHLIKVWLNSKINVDRTAEYKKTIESVWDIFIEMAKTKNPGLFVKEAALAKKQVLGNSPLNDENKLEKLKPYEIAVLGAEEIEGMPDKKGIRQTQTGWRHTVVDGQRKMGQRLMTSNDECTALDDKFPCFKNWQGNKDKDGKTPTDQGYDPAKPMGHSDECYNELWHTQTMKNFETGTYDGDSCYTKTKQVGFKTQMAKPFTKYPGKTEQDTLIPYTIKVMNKQPIPSVKMDIERIRKVADTSNQYEPIYSLNNVSDKPAEHSIFEDDEGKKIKINEEARQINRSAKVAALACYGEEPTFDDGNKDARGNANANVPFACKDRFRDEDKNFPRPKKCLDYYWEKNTKNIPAFANESYDSTNTFKDTTSWNRGKNFHILDKGYNPYPPGNDTYGKVWGNANEDKDKFEDKIHYKSDNTTLNNDLKKMIKYIEDFGDNPRNASDYDKYLYFKRSVFETINEHEDAIWEYLKAEEKVKTGSSYSIGQDGKPWVKMCWGDFKDALLLEYRDTKNKIKEDGDGTLNLKDAPDLKNIIEDDGRATSGHAKNMSLYRKVIKTDDKFKYNPGFGKINVGGRMKFELDYPTSITEKLYNKTWFPFWRFFMFLPNEGVKYYRRVEFNRNEKTQHDKTKARGKSFQSSRVNLSACKAKVSGNIDYTFVQTNSDCTGCYKQNGKIYFGTKQNQTSCSGKQILN